METLLGSNGQRSMTSTSSVRDSLARLSVLLENGEDSMIPEVLYSSRLLDALTKSNHRIVCLRTSRAGLLSHDKGHTFETILRTLDELGYDAEWEVLNSKDFGVPQNRERVFIIGYIRGKPRPEIFPLGRKNKKDNQGITSTAIDANYGKGLDKHGQRIGIIHNIYNGFGEDIRLFNEYSPTIRTPSGGNSIPAVIDYNKLHIRRLTPLECERLQGFPDNWTEHGIDEEGKQISISDTQRYKCIGNAVTVNVVREIFRRWK